MRARKLDARTADALLAGAVTSEDLPNGYNRAADLLHALRAQPAVTPTGAAMALAGEEAAVASMRAAVLANPAPVQSSRRTPTLTKVLRTKAAVAAAAVVLSGGAAAAAATGNLPSAAQRATSDVLRHVGISVPSPHAADSHSDLGVCTATTADARGDASPHRTVWPSASTCTSGLRPSNQSSSRATTDSEDNKATAINGSDDDNKNRPVENGSEKSTSTTAESEGDHRTTATTESENNDTTTTTKSEQKTTTTTGPRQENSSAGTKSEDNSASSTTSDSSTASMSSSNTDR